MGLSLIRFGFLLAVLCVGWVHVCTDAVAQEASVDAGHEDARQLVKIAVLAYRGVDATMAKWQPTIDYLTESVPGYRFAIVPVNLEQMAEVVGEGRVDFILTNPGNYVEHEARHGVVRIATLKPSESGLAGNRFGAVIFSRAQDKRIHALRDVAGKRFMAINEDAFGGFQMAWREMQAHNIDPHTHLSDLIFVGFPQDQVVEAVLSGKVDVGTCRTGLLEQMANSGKIDLADLRILNPQSVDGFPFALSTRLYPEWPFARLGQTSQSLSRQVVIALLGMEPDSPAAVQGGYAGWTVPLDYQPVHDLFRELRIGPYGDPIEIRISDLLEQYWHWLLFAVVLAGIGILWVMRVEHLVAVRTRELSQANDQLEGQIAERRRAEETARARQNELAHISRVNTMGELTANLAHEINQPLSAISNYATGSLRRLDRGQMDDADLHGVLGTIAREAERAGEVLRRVRTFVRKGEVRTEAFDLNAIVTEAVDITQSEAHRHHVAIDVNVAEPLPFVVADKVQIEQVLLNLIGNALEALQDVHDRQRRISIQLGLQDKDPEPGQVRVVCRVIDNAIGLPSGSVDHLFDAFYSTKANGMGMGLSISRSIIESSGGKLWVEQGADRGAVFAFTLPTANAGEV